MYFIAVLGAQPLHLKVNHCFHVLMKERLGRLNLNMIITWSVDLKRMPIRSIEAYHFFNFPTYLQI